MPDSPDELELLGSALPECLNDIHDLLARLWRLHPNVAELDQVLFATAVLEVANNLVTHGEAVTFRLLLRVNHEELHARFVDDGFEAIVDLEVAELPDVEAESGRGLAIARLALDEFTYERVSGRNRWSLTRRRDGATATRLA